NKGASFNINDTVNPYETLANPNNLGLSTGAPTYITGTGAFDSITVTRAGDNLINFTVKAYRNWTAAAGFTNLLATYSRINVSASTLLIDGGQSADEITLDSNLGIHVYVNGGAGVDRLIIQGRLAPNATYTPGTNTALGLDDNSDLRGTIVSGSTTITY